MTLRFLHAADLHLDSPLRGLSAYEGAPLERIRGATRQAFTKLVDAAIAQQVPLLLLAGDVWDGDWPDIGTGLFFAGEMGRLRRAGTRVLMIRGNHDAESRITRAVTLPDNVRVFRADRPETVALDDLAVAVHGQSFARPDVTENIALGYPDAVPERINIGMLHTALEGHANHNPYAPCRLSELKAKRYDYWALGHVHEHAVLADGRSGAEGGTIAFPGVLQGRHVRETGAKGALLVEIGADGIALERLTFDVVRWHLLEVEVSVCASLAEVSHALGTALADLCHGERSASEERLQAVRVVLVGRSPLHGMLSLEAGRLREEALAQTAAVSQDGIYLEQVQVATEPAMSPESLAHRHDAIADLQQILNQAERDEALVGELGAHLSELLKHLPPEVRKALSENEPALIAAIEDGDVTALLPGARAALLDRLARA